MRQLHSFEAETSLVGALLLAPETYDTISPLVDSSMFANVQPQLVFEAIKDTLLAGTPVDVVTVSEQLERRGLYVLQQAGGIEFVISVAQNTPSASNITSYAELVRDYARERALFNTANQIKTLLMQDDMTTDERFQQAEALFTGLDLHRGSQQGPVEVKESVQEYVAHLEWLYDNPGLYGVATGLATVDNRLQGLKPGELYIVAGRPGMGKTTYAMQVALSAAQTGHRTFIASQEMPRRQLVQRLVASIGHIPLPLLKNASVLQHEDYSVRLMAATGRLVQLESAMLLIDDRSTMDIDDLRSECRRVHRKHGKLGLVMVDYLQLLTDRTTNSRYDEVSSVSRKLKALAKELDCPVLALSQLSRECDKRPDKRPLLSDLRESGQIEQDADVIQFLYRDEVYNPHSNQHGMMEVITAKFRDGTKGTDYVNFIGAENRVADLPSGARIPQPAQQSQGFQLS
ncbi:MAG: replicative DNA helicase [Marinobacterium sp.]|nr:replicative DNA helicase [Marinobacterium sp.]